MTTQWKKDLIKKAAHRDSTRREAKANDDEPKERDVELGPFFLSGAILLVYGLKRRSKVAVAAGLGAIWLDQRSAFGRGLKHRIRARSEQLAA
jgi:hypothetical protein